MIEAKKIYPSDLIWDDNKNIFNVEKHGINFEEAHLVLNSKTITFVDDRKDYGEVRYIAIGEWHKRIVILAYTIRDNFYRIISMRKANEREQSYYYAKIKEI